MVTIIIQSSQALNYDQYRTVQNHVERKVPGLLSKLLWSSPNGDLNSINLYSALDVVNEAIFVVLR